jgi:hypothetical protein
MEQLRRVRIVKREQRAGGATDGDAAAPRESSAAVAAREAKDVVSGWVREHQRRSEEFRQNYSTLLGQLGFSAPWAAAGKGALTPALSAGK